MEMAKIAVLLGFQVSGRSCPLLFNEPLGQQFSQIFQVYTKQKAQNQRDKTGNQYPTKYTPLLLSRKQP